jgi:hypothetical protein
VQMRLSNRGHSQAHTTHCHLAYSGAPASRAITSLAKLAGAVHRKIVTVDSSRQHMRRCVICQTAPAEL